MAGYTGLANTILNEYNFYQSDLPFETTDQPDSQTKYEYFDLGGGDEMLQFANPTGSVNMLVKFSP